MFNMLGRTVIIALRFEYFMGRVIHVHQAAKQAASARTNRFTPICVITNVSVNPSFRLHGTSLDSHYYLHFSTGYT